MHRSCGRLGGRAEMRRGSGAADGAVVLASALSAFAKRVTAPVVAAVAASSREGGGCFSKINQLC